MAAVSELPESDEVWAERRGDEERAETAAGALEFDDWEGYALVQYPHAEAAAALVRRHRLDSWRSCASSTRGASTRSMVME
jgi:hypothetical protein